MSPEGAALNGNILYLYLPYWHANVVRYDDLSSSFNLWYSELTSIRKRYCTLFNFVKISFTVGSLCTSLRSTLFSLAGSRHSLIFPFGFVTNMKLLHHSAVLFMHYVGMQYCLVAVNVLIPSLMAL